MSVKSEVAPEQWFKVITGFAEPAFREINFVPMLRRDDNGDIYLKNPVSGQVYNCGSFSLPTVGDLRTAHASDHSVAADKGPVFEIRTADSDSIRFVDVGSVQAAPSSAGAMFQVASNFNGVEAIGSHSHPGGETFTQDYCWDRTQGPRASIFAGGAAVARVLFPWAYPLSDAPADAAGADADVRDAVLPLSAGWVAAAPAQVAAGAASTAALVGQSKTRQVEALGALREDYPIRNGYVVLPLSDASGAVFPAGPADEGWRARLDATRVMLHERCQVTFAAGSEGYSFVPLPDTAHTVDQVFVAAMNLAETRSGNRCGDLAAEKRRFLLDMAYEGTYLSAAKCKSRELFLTLVGGGVFHNPLPEIYDAMARAHARYASASALERVTLVLYSIRDQQDIKDLSAVLGAQGIRHEWVHYSKGVPHTKLSVLG